MDVEVPAVVVLLADVAATPTPAIVSVPGRGRGILCCELTNGVVWLQICAIISDGRLEIAVSDFIGGRW